MPVNPQRPPQFEPVHLEEVAELDTGGRGVTSHRGSAVRRLVIAILTRAMRLSCRWDSMPLHRVTPIIAAIPLFVAAINLLRSVVERKCTPNAASPTATETASHR